MSTLQLARKAAVLTVLATVAAAVTGPDAQAFGRKKKQEEAPRPSATFAAEGLTQTVKGLEVSFTEGGKLKRVYLNDRCSSVFYGGNLATCVRICGSTPVVAELSQQADYEGVWSTVDGYRFGGTLPVKASAAGKVSVNKYEKPSTRYTVSSSDSDSAVCKSDFDGNLCLAEMAGRLAGDNPVPAYREELESLASPVSGLERGLAEKAAELAAKVGEVETAMQAAGLTDYRRNGWFFATNMKNAPALLCQLKSQASGVTGPTETLEAALRDNQQELRRSMSFLSRMPSEDTDDSAVIEDETDSASETESESESDSDAAAE